MEWMCNYTDENGSKCIASKTVRHFPQYSRGSADANNQRASRQWKSRESFLHSSGKVIKTGGTTSVTRYSKNGSKRVYLKGLSGRGRPITPWVRALHMDLRAEFVRLRKLGVKFNMCTLRHLAIVLINDSISDAYHKNMKDAKSGTLIDAMVTSRWIQTFTNRHGIVSGELAGNHQLSAAKQLFFEKEVAFHLGTLKREFETGTIDENDVENADETHFMINMDNGRTLSFSGESEVKYADVVSGGDSVTMMVRLSGGRVAIVQNTFMVFKNS